MRRVSILRAALRWGVRENLLEANSVPDLRLSFDVYQHVPYRQKTAVVKTLPALVGKGKMVGI